MQRGEIWLADLEPARGSEANKTRPVVIVMNDRGARRVGDIRRGVVTVAPVTSNVRRVLDFQVELPAGTAGLSVDSKVQAEQLVSCDFSRFVRRLGLLPDETMREVDEAIALHLGLN